MQVKQKMFTLRYGKFTQDNTYQILSELAGLRRRYNRKHFGVFFSVHSVEYDVLQ